MDQQAPEKMTLNEAVESFTGFDELAIEKHFKSDITKLLTEKAIFAMRAAVFILERRSGSKDPDAYKASMDLTIGTVQDYFADEPDEIMPDDPETEVGKGSSEPDEQPTSSPPSVS